jgi:hypothetical protein
MFNSEVQRQRPKIHRPMRVLSIRMPPTPVQPTRVLLMQVALAQR